MKKRAFTLAELLTAVLVISVIMVALAPVITKRMRDTITLENSDKEGLKVYVTPGDYVFDVPVGIDTLFIQGSGGGGGGAGATYVEKEQSFYNTSSSGQMFEVPAGVNQIVLNITGSGGGGGAGLGRTASDICKGGTGHHLAVADNGKDLCVSGAEKPSNQSVWGEITTVDSGTPFTCASYTCCWSNVVGNPSLGSCSGNGCNRTVCTYPAAVGWCSTYNSSAGDSFPNNSDIGRSARLLTKDEAQRILNNGDIGNGTNKWDICMQKLSCSGGSATGNINTNNIDKCPMGKQGSADGSANGYAYPESVWLANRYRFNAQTCNVPFINTDTYDQRYAFSVFCAYELNNWYQFSGAGGASGAVLKNITLNVKPGDKLNIKVGAGGTGGSPNSTNSAQNGKQTIVEHYEKNNGAYKLKTKYVVNGGKMGKPATRFDNGAEYETNCNPSGSNCASPMGTCRMYTYDENGVETRSDIPCTVASYSGKAGTETQGGSGATVENKGTPAEGGKLGETMGAEGKTDATGKSPVVNAASINDDGYGYGGGGGTCARGVRNPVGCSNGGNGAQGKVTIKYKRALPGGGGGSAARVAGVDSNTKLYEIKYSVQEGSKVALKVGYGGAGGSAEQDGFSGTVSVVGRNSDIIFMAGQGGKVATDADKLALRGGAGGQSGCIDENGNVNTSVSKGIKLNNSSTTYTINPPSGAFKGGVGGRGGVPDSSLGYNLTNSPFAYGFTGGMGGIPFNVVSALIESSVTCGGGPAANIGTGSKYLCATGTINGATGKMHSAQTDGESVVNNRGGEYGGAGGGGGGVLPDSTEYGAGGNGSSGYLRIRWNAAEQNQ